MKFLRIDTGNDFEFNIEDLIDNTIFNNQEEIIIIDLNFEDKKINLRIFMWIL